MKPKDIFNLILRLIGLAFLYRALDTIPSAVLNFCPAFPHFYFRNLFPSLLVVGWPLLIAWWLIRGAPWLMRLAYPETPEMISSNSTGVK
jgi:hypothetical protein